MPINTFDINNNTDEQLIQAIKAGEYTLEEIFAFGLMRPRRAKLTKAISDWKAQKQIDEKNQADEESDWSSATAQDSVSAYESYITKYSQPGMENYGIHMNDARNALQEAMKKVEEARILEKQREAEDRKQKLRALLDDMRDNSWRYNQAKLKTLFKGTDVYIDGIGPDSDFLNAKMKLSYQELVDYGIIPSSITINDLLRSDFNMPATQISDMGKTPEGRTDVYFLGVPRSGKSSVLAAIIYKLYKDGRAGYEPHIVNSCDPCRNYYDGLIRSIGEMKPPASTPLDTISFIKLNIRNKKSTNRITIYELSGESFRLASEAHSTEGGGAVWKALGASACLANNNPKLLFFVLDYSIISQKYEGYITPLEQALSLDKSLDVFSTDGSGANHEIGCTLSKVDTVGIIMTKCDLMSSQDPKNRANQAENYIRANFLNFAQSLYGKCKKFGINKANDYMPYVLTFSLGQFYIGNTLVYNDSYAADIIEFISQVTRKEKKNIWDILRGR